MKQYPEQNSKTKALTDVPFEIEDKKKSPQYPMTDAEGISSFPKLIITFL